MILRVLALAGGVTGAAGLSQFPEFSQQYMQRLGGAVDELTRQVDRYSEDASKLDLSLDAYIDQLSTEGDLANTQAGNMRSDILRHTRLSEALGALEGAGPFMRARLAAYMGDRDVAGEAYAAFKPAVPVTMEGAAFAGTGFFAGWAGLSVVFALLGRLWAGLRGLMRRSPA